MAQDSIAKFYLLAEQYGIEPEVQVELLLAFAGAVQPAFAHWLASVEAELQKDKEENMPVEHTSELDAFFDRDLARQHIPQLLEATDSCVVAGGDCIVAQVKADPEYLAVMEESLRGLPTDTQAGMLIGGLWYDLRGDTIMIMVVAGDHVGTAYVDAVMALKPGTYDDVPNVSLPPRNQMAGEYIFDHPDGFQRVVHIHA